MKPVILAVITCALAVLGVGCSTPVRENIFASVNTTIGATVMENDKTQLYEARLGFIRHQFYSIPTGKRVGTNSVNRPRAVPQVVSGIRSESGIKHLLIGSDTSENFATGFMGTRSPAAIAMYVSQAKNEEMAKQAALGVKIAIGTFNNDEASDCLRAYWMPNGRVDTAHETALENWIDLHLGPDVDIPDLINDSAYVLKRRQALQAVGFSCD